MAGVVIAPVHEQADDLDRLLASYEEKKAIAQPKGLPNYMVDPWAFVHDLCFTVDEASSTNNIPFPSSEPIIDEYIHSFLYYPIVLWEKSRRMLLSWTACAFDVWLLLGGGCDQTRPPWLHPEADCWDPGLKDEHGEFYYDRTRDSRGYKQRSTYGLWEMPKTAFRDQVETLKPGGTNRQLWLLADREETSAYFIYRGPDKTARAKYLIDHIPMTKGTSSSGWWWQEWPRWSYLMKPPTVSNSWGNILEGAPAGSHKVRGRGGLHIHYDEFAMLVEAQESYVNAKMTTQNGGHVAMITTAYGGTFAERIVNGQINDRNMAVYL